MSTTINASTSVVLVASSNGPHIVYFPPISTIGRFITVRDNNGYVSTGNYITLSTIGNTSFGSNSSGINSLQITQPYGFMTLDVQNDSSYAIVNTFAFPAGSTAAFVSNVTASTINVLNNINMTDLGNGNTQTIFSSTNNLYFNNSQLGDVTGPELISTTIGVEIYASNIAQSRLLRRTIAVGYTSNTVSNINIPSGTIVYSDNNYPWNTAFNGTGGFSNGGVDITYGYGAGIWVAAGNNQSGTNSENTGFLQWSEDGSYWVASTSPALSIAQGRTRVFWANNLFHAVGSNTNGGTSTIMHSVDGKTWNFSQPTPTIPFQSPGGVGYGTGVAFGCNVWVVSGVQANSMPYSLLYSLTGSNWSPATSVNWGAPGAAYDVAFNGTRFLAFVAKDLLPIRNIAYSGNGTDWFLIPSSGNVDFNNEPGYIAAPTPELALAVSYSYKRYSVDGGLTWANFGGLPVGEPSRPYWDGSTWWISINTGTNAQSIWYSFTGSNNWSNWLNDGGFSNKGYARGFFSLLAQSNLNLQLVSTVSGISSNFTSLNLGASTLTFTGGVKIQAPNNSVAIGNGAGRISQAANSIAIGTIAGTAVQSDYSVAIGYGAGNSAQGQYSVAVGPSAGQLSQNTNNVAIGYGAQQGYVYPRAVAIGALAGQTQQGSNAIAIGFAAGQSQQGANSIVLNATGVGLNGQTPNALFIDPIRNDSSSQNSLLYNTTSKEITYGIINSVQYATYAGTASNLFANSNYTINSLVMPYVKIDANAAGKVAIGNGAGSSGQALDAVAVGSGAGGNNQGYESIAVGNGAALQVQGPRAVALGSFSGQNSQGEAAVAVGRESGNTGQNTAAIAVGYQAGYLNQSTSAVAIGSLAGKTSQNANAIAIGASAGFSSQGLNSIALGLTAGAFSQNDSAIAIGANAGNNTQGFDSIAIGRSAGSNSQGRNCIAIGNGTQSNSQAWFGIGIGYNAANTSQQLNGIAIGNQAGANSQGEFAVGIGYIAGSNSQGSNAVAIGKEAGYTSQKPAAVAIGAGAGQSNQGFFSVAVGPYAGQTNQPNNSIILNATGSAVNPTISDAFYVAPVRNDASPANILYYNTGTKEISYGAVTGQIDITPPLIFNGNIIILNKNTVIDDPANTNIDIRPFGQLAVNKTTFTVSMGYGAGFDSQQDFAIAIGRYAGGTNQQQNSIAIGQNAGQFTMGQYSVGIGFAAGYQNQNDNAVAIGPQCGFNAQKAAATAIGSYSGYHNQGVGAIAIGNGAATSNQGNQAVAIANSAGNTGQGVQAIAIGQYAGSSSQGDQSIAIGYFAGYQNQGANSIVLNASGSIVNGTTANAFYVAPIRYTAATGNVLCYDTSTKEVIYASNLQIPNGIQVTNGSVSASDTVSGNTAYGLTYVYAGSAAGPGYFLCLNNKDPAQVAIACYSNTIVQSSDLYFQVAGGTGNCLNRGGSYGQFSDSNFKENIITSRNYLEDLTKIRIVNYNLKNSTEKYLGVIAQEVQQILPGLVDTTQSTLSVKMSIFTPMLITAVQSLHSTNQGLQDTLRLQQEQISQLLAKYPL